MYSPTQIKSCFAGLVGFPQTFSKDVDKLDADLTTSLSGMMLDQSSHPLITIENIAAITEMFLSSEVQAYSAVKTYTKDYIVYDSTSENTALIGSNVFISLIDNNLNHLPNTSATQWRKTNLISIYLRRVVEGASINLFNAVFTQKKLYELAKTLLTDTSLYEGVGNLNKTVTKYSRFVGYKITPKAQDTVISISTLGMQFTAANPVFKLYVYHSSQLDPLQIITIAHDKPVSFQWKALEEVLSLPYIDDTIDRGGTYYIGYYEDDLVGSAIWKETNFAGTGCSSCNGQNGHLYKQWNKFMELQPFYVDHSNLNVDRTFFDTWKVVNITNQNYGLNFKIKVQCDVSNFICNNKLIFGNAYKVQMVHDILNDMAYSMRDNQKKEKAGQMAALALNGDKQDYAKGVKADLQDAIKVISFDMSGISRQCLPCDTYAGGITMTSVYR